MKKPVLIHIPDHYKAETAFEENFPSNGAYELTNSKCSYWEHPIFSIIEQYYDYRDAYLCLVEIQARTAIDIPITSILPDLYAVYQLTGGYQIWLHEKSEAPTLQLQKGESLMIYMPPQKYIARVSSGNHLIFYFVVSADFLLREPTSELNAIKEPLEQLRIRGENHTSAATLKIVPSVESSIMHFLSAAKGSYFKRYKMAHNLIINLLLHYNDPFSLKSDMPIGYQDILYNLRLFIEEKIEEGDPISIEDITKKAGLAYTQLEKLFRRSYHQSIWQYVVNTKLNMGEYLLRNSQLKVSQIAYFLNMSSEHFTRIFKAKYGMSPYDYMKTYRHTQE